MLSVFLHVLNWQQTRGLGSAFWLFKKKIGKESFRKLKGYKSNLYNLFIQRNRERERKKERLVSSSKRYEINMYSSIYTTVLEVMQNIRESIILEFIIADEGLQILTYAPQRLVAIDQWEVLYCATPTVTRDLRL